MLIEKISNKYIIHSEGSILKTIQKVNTHKGRIIFSVTEKNRLEGVLTNGDILRWLSTQSAVDLNLPVSSITNKNFLYATTDDSAEKIEKLLEKAMFIPVLDDQHRLVSVARHRAPKEALHIADYAITDESPTFVIAEIGINHNGSLALAKELVDAAVHVGADCAKFQMRDLKVLYKNAGDASDPSENLGSQYTLDLLTRFQLTNNEMLEVFDYCKAQNILPLCTPWDESSLSILESYEMPAYKIASADLTNLELLRAVSKTGKPMICSTGMSTEEEIVQSVSMLKKLGAQYALLHCNSTYPAPFKDINLKYMDRIGEIGQCPIGYSGHERDVFVAIAAVSRGAKIIEKHITLDRNMEGNDHKVSLLPQEFKRMVAGIRQTESALGENGKRQITQGELVNRVTLAKSLYINCVLKKGEPIQAHMIESKSPGRGLQPNRRQELVGLRAKKDFAQGDFFYPSDLALETTEARNYSFNRPWGVAVRYYDLKEILAKSNPDFLEFHLSFKDLDVDLHQFFDQPYDLDYTVHSPDFFSGDHLLDPCSSDKSHRERSLFELQRVINVTRELKPYFKKATTPMIIASVGGFTRDRLITSAERKEKYELLAEGLASLDSEGVEIIPQTLPPFPWYFGGQLYLNLFVDPTDTVEFCKTHNYRLCFDTCHSKLACNHFNWSFSQFVEAVAPYTAHLHLSDALGVDAEGLQIGEGDIDMPALVSSLDYLTPASSFIPEIWQGHENGGEGFWLALERLEQIYKETGNHKE